MGGGLTPSSARAMWIDYLSAVAGPDHTRSRIPDRPEAWAFGLGREMADELAQLVLAGTKRATASSLEVLLLDGDPMPQPGMQAIILDGREQAVCIIETTRVHIAPLDSVTEAFAWREGEDDRTRDSWLEGHRRFFQAEYAEKGIPFSDGIPVIFEEFAVVWPQSVADT